MKRRVATFLIPVPRHKFGRPLRGLVPRGVLSVVSLLLALWGVVAIAAAGQAEPGGSLYGLGQAYGPDTGFSVRDPDGPLSSVAGVFAQQVTDKQVAEAREYLTAVASAQSLVGSDDRVRVTDTTVAPYRSVVHLVKFVGGKVDSLCTGAFVADDLILTAAHCIKDGLGSPAADDFLVVPGENTTRFPFGNSLTSDWRIPKAWVDSNYQDVVFDIALLKVANTQLGRTVGRLGVITAMTDGDLSSPELNAYIVGYPGDKPLGTMWWAGVQRLRDVYPEALIYDFDVAHGQSGSVIFRGSDRRIFSIVSEGCEPAGRICGYSAGHPLYNNFSVRITVTVARALADYANSMGSSLYYEVPATPKPSPTVAPTATASRPPAATPQSTGGFPPPPPTTFYGAVAGATPGGRVIATVVDNSSSTVCGDGVVVLDGSGSAVYVIDVIVDAQKAGCGKAGRQVRFYFTPTGGSPGRLASNVVSWVNPGGVDQPLTLGPPASESVSILLTARDGGY